MIERLLHVLVALAVVIATVMPGHVQAMPMPSGMGGMGQHQLCQNCPEPSASGTTSPAKMLVCPLLACVSIPATLPTPVFLPGRVAFRVTFQVPTASHWTEASPAPDPFPPRPIVLR
jgi:hypothetical protein